MVLLTGCPRSGTTAAAKILRLDYGPDADLGAVVGSEWQTYMEHRSFADTSERLLGSGGGSWLDTPDLVLGDVVKADRLPPAVKDPRICLTFPSWRRCVAVDDVVMVVREPSQNVGALQAFTGVLAPRGYAIWKRFNGDMWLWHCAYPGTRFHVVESGDRAGFERVGRALGCEVDWSFFDRDKVTRYPEEEVMPPGILELWLMLKGVA